MEGLLFNVNNGYATCFQKWISSANHVINSYIEGIVRGYRNSLLTGANYTNMTQCESIDGEPLSPSPFYDP